MKKIILFLSSVLLMSCNYLDFDESVGYQKEDLFSVFARSKTMLTNIYSFLPSDLGNWAMQDAATDDGIYVWPTDKIHIFTNGSWSAINSIDNKWDQYYAGIRAANLFLESYQIDFPDIKYNADYKELMAQYQYYPYEARFLRAFFYFELIKRYNKAVLVTKTMNIDEVNSLQPSSYENMTAFIVKECDEIENKLPVNFNDIPGKEVGRITRGTVMALKSRVLLYAASKLHNPKGDLEKWKTAALAAKALIDASEANGWYQLVDEAVVNNQNAQGLIFQKMEGSSNQFERTNFPVGYEGGNSGLCPSQNLMEAFEMIDGTPFDFKNPEHVKEMYNSSKRDPRFYKTMLFNGAKWKGEIVESFNGGKNGYPRNGASPTGYYLKKYLQESVKLTTGNATEERHVWVLFRYAELFLNYAEAMNEAFGPQYTDGVFTLSAEDAINKVRTRAGMPAVLGLSKADFTQRIRNERRVEFAFEGHRFWDIRRWKIGEETTAIQGLSITKTNSTFDYKRILVESRKWEDKMSFYPIEHKECLKNTNLIQNPGW